MHLHSQHCTHLTCQALSSTLSRKRSRIGLSQPAQWTMALAGQQPPTNEANTQTKSTAQAEHWPSICSLPPRFAWSSWVKRAQEKPVDQVSPQISPCMRKKDSASQKAKNQEGLAIASLLEEKSKGWKNKSVLLWIRGKIQPRCSAQEAADRLRREERSRFGCPGDASAKEKSVVLEPVLIEASNKTILGQSCHTRRHARLQIIQSTLTWHLIHCSKPGEKQNHTARRWKQSVSLPLCWMILDVWFVIGCWDSPVAPVVISVLGCPSVSSTVRTQRCAGSPVHCLDPKAPTQPYFQPPDVRPQPDQSALCHGSNHQAAPS